MLMKNAFIFVKMNIFLAATEPIILQYGQNQSAML